ncbi:MAG: type II secretion system protein [Candidatus Paceibacterota bacterium]|jgi:prepilin-type N-terminal cleavage/methylation domain-containing protein
MNTSKFFHSLFSSAIKQKIKKIKKAHLKAFTILELLVVIAIIGILPARIFASMAGVQAIARDGHRQFELSQTKKALVILSVERRVSDHRSGRHLIATLTELLPKL